MPTPKDFGGQVSDFKNAVHTKRQEQDYTRANIGNMDETMVHFDMAPKSTNNINGEILSILLPLVMPRKDLQLPILHLPMVRNCQQFSKKVDLQGSPQE